MITANDPSALMTDIPLLHNFKSKFFDLLSKGRPVLKTNGKSSSFAIVLIQNTTFIDRKLVRPYDPSILISNCKEK